jgi:hypothetical protein
MVLSNTDHSKIRQYLLGSLTEGEQQTIEERLMTEDALFQELEVSKNEIIEEYCAGELTAAECEWLQEHYLASGEGRERYKFALALRRIDKPAPTPRFVVWFQKPLRLWESRPWAFAGAAAIVLILIAGVLFISRNTRQTTLAVTLTRSLGQRGATGPGVERIRPGSEVRELQIALILSDSGAIGNETYRAELDNGVTQRTLTPNRRDASSVVVHLHTSEVPSGFYVVRLFVTPSNGTEQQLPGDYRFIIE